jgi:putative spermidine/putrescine transport system permease protein
MSRKQQFYLAILATPAAAVFAAFFLLPIGRLIIVSISGSTGGITYWAFLTTPRYFESLISTILLAIVVTIVTLVIATISALFLERNRFPGRNLLISMLTMPLVFPGVVVGFLIIMLTGRQGVVGSITAYLFNNKIVLAYSMIGLFLGYVYFSIPRVILTVMAAAEKLDPALEEAARSLGASRWRVVRDVFLPGLMPALIASGAIVFSTAMGAFGTAFTLATDIHVLPMTIYTTFTLHGNFAMAAALSIILGIITWGILTVTRLVAGPASGMGAGG